MENASQIIIYQTEDGQTKVDVRVDNDTVWLSLNQLADLFQRDKSVISKHIKNVFTEGELDENSVVAKMQQLPPMAKVIKLNSSISMSLSPSATASNRIAARNFGFEQPSV